MAQQPTTTTEWISLGEGYDAYAAVPSWRSPAGVVIVAPELFGITADIREAAERLAAEGYAAVAPDFHWRSEPRAEIPYDDAGRARGFELLNRMTRDDLLADIETAQVAAVARYAPGHASAIVGFSLGGHFAVLAATQIPFALAVTFYGGWMVRGGIPVAEPHPPLADSRLIAANGTYVLGFSGDRDHVVPADEAREIERLLADAGVEHDMVVYPGVEHGFFCAGRPASYDEKAAADAWSRLLGALREHVGR
ncbi:dienelactone hydrolase family protein [Streptomyces sp. RB6PN25]|uniref:Dienelactone hydrolase family protein n=1 Tax=Streptomyces humicola TaxID=2953240 RepID=A0ABT1Q1E2_9ACTN|nr:dienelactone hydrolase family protein [Streptomyces humicola]MCQ4083721.1 dienelactone hydrolase family protein [Streptomyces humicola]